MFATVICLVVLMCSLTILSSVLCVLINGVCDMCMCLARGGVGGEGVSG